jgi:DNA replicative helicase MCM subunit Mcm2 (Cdc46/Mcm family)
MDKGFVNRSVVKKENPGKALPLQKKQADKEQADKPEARAHTKANVQTNIQTYDASPEQTSHGIISLFSHLIPLNKDNRLKLDLIKELFSSGELKEMKYLLRTHKLRFSEEGFGTTNDFFQDSKYLVLASNSINKRVKEQVDFFNRRIRQHGREAVFLRFSQVAEQKILSVLAPSIIGLDDVKRAALLQLFAKEKVHILLLGDPSTGKTVVLRSVAELAPISSFGLGSGSSKAGLTVNFSGKEMIKGLLPLADNGIACIDELNLMKSADRAGLLNAMEKGFITYDKANNHVQLDARIKVFASANPDGDKFVGNTIDVLKKQIPFEQALLSRFHLMFLIRRPSTQEFLKITENIIKGDKKEIDKHDEDFIKQYVEYCLEHDVEFDKSLSHLIQGFVEDIRKDEDKFLVEISPRMVIGIMNMAKASARLRLRDRVDKDDIIKVLKVFNSALYIKRN